MEKINSILQKIRASVHATEPDATLILYGSYARGNYREGSDVDLLILLDKENVIRLDEKRVKYPLYEIELTQALSSVQLFCLKKFGNQSTKFHPFIIMLLRKGNSYDRTAKEGYNKIQAVSY